MMMMMCSLALIRWWILWLWLKLLLWWIRRWLWWIWHLLWWICTGWGLWICRWILLFHCYLSAAIDNIKNYINNISFLTRRLIAINWNKISIWTQINLIYVYTFYYYLKLHFIGISVHINDKNNYISILFEINCFYKYVICTKSCYILIELQFCWYMFNITPWMRALVF